MSLRSAGRFVLLVVALTVLAALPAEAEPRNVVLLIGDGMGFEHVRAASLFAYGEEGQLFMEQLPATGRVTTHPAGGKAVPDSASAATALAAGVKVSTGVVAMRYPGDGEPVETVLERDRRPLSMAWISDELLAKTIDVWSRNYGRPISEDEAVEILMNVKRFAEVLLEARKEVDGT
jgi:hypothetical protein